MDKSPHSDPPSQQPPSLQAETRAPREISPHLSTGLLYSVGLVSRARDAAICDFLGVNLTDLRALSLLLRNGSTSPSELAEIIGLGRPATSMVLDRLARLGYVSRHPDPCDGRRIVVQATAHAAVTASSAFMPMMTALDAVLERRSEAERAIIEAYLNDAVETMESHVAEVKTKAGARHNVA